MDKLNILITAVSRKVALIKAFKDAINTIGVKGKVVTVDMDRMSPGLYFGSSHYIVPHSSSSEYLPVIKEICIKEGINIIIPTIDEELPLFGNIKSDFAIQGITIVVSSKQTGLICNDKFLTYKFFRENNIPTPYTFLKEEIVRTNNLSYPLFIKPRFGRGSIHCFPIKDEAELRFFANYIDDPIIQEYLTGKEFTIDVLADMNGRVISVVPRERIVIRSGVTDRGRTVKDEMLINYAIKISESLNIIGPSNIQCKVSGSDIKFFEINPRFSGGIQLTINAGANFAIMIAKMFNGKSLKPMIGEFQEGLTMLSYEDSIFKQL